MWNMLKVNNKDTKTTEQRQWRLSGIFIVNFEHISHHIFFFLCGHIGPPSGENAVGIKMPWKTS